MKPNKLESIARPEMRLLLACARASSSIIDAMAIRPMLTDGIDWATFTRSAIHHGVVSLVGNTLEEVAPDLVPDDLLDALRMHKEYIRSKNEVTLEGFRQSAAALVNHAIDAIWFNGPVLGSRAYSNTELRVFGAPRVLVREPAAGAAIAALCDIGYLQQQHLTTPQLDFMRYLQGREVLFNHSLRTSAEVCARFTSVHMALEIDYEGLWRRARPEAVLGQTLHTLAPEDELLVLSIRQGGAAQWKLAEACDFAALVTAYPELDWRALTERARAQGCLRMLRLARALARGCFGAGAASEIDEASEPIVEAMVARAIEQWQSERPSDGLDNRAFSLQSLRLHDGSARRARYIARCLVLPSRPHVSRIALPRRLTNVLVYAVLKVVQEAALLPLLRTVRKVRAQGRRVRDLLVGRGLLLALIPASKEQHDRWRSYHAARTAAQRLLAEQPNNGTAWQALGDAWFRLGRHAAALAAYDKALASAPEDAILLKKRATAIGAGRNEVGRLHTGEEDTINAADANAWARQAASLAAEKRYAEATVAADKALAIDPRHSIAIRVGIRSRISSCDWRRSEEDERLVADAFRAGRSLITPAGNRAICDSEAQNLIAAQLWAKPFVLPPASLPRARKYRHKRIRLAYLCSEYHEHPVGWHIVGVFEHHDRSRFETIAISLGGPNSSPIRQRIRAACDQFISVHDQPDEQIARLVSDMEIDIAIDLDRFAARARPGILARRPAPLQVSYFGNAGTTGAPFFDYIIADRTLIPSPHSRYYTEKAIYLPNSYQCNDSKRRVSQSTPTRAEVGLPNAGFVYCCFNQSYKIRPPLFDIWMRLLQGCPGSILWLLGDEPHVVHNLRREAAARGIGAERLVFAPLLPNEEHLARHRLADLFLDTLPCNAHVTASDALWAGLPMVTCLGNTFAGRVGASLLRAVGLPELVTESLPQYEALAMSLAREPQRLAAFKAKLLQNRERAALFDTARFTHDLERAFETIWQREQTDLVPEAIAV
jgi:predicted O-linked N-acetylglucosamine transferase (SPINDLY family)